MTRIACFLLLLVFVSSPRAWAQPTDRELVMRNFETQTECWNKGDITCYVTSSYVRSDSTRVISQQGVVYGYDNILELYKNNWNENNMGFLRFDELHLEALSPEYYYVTGRFRVTQPAGSVHEGRFSVLMKKVNNQWLIYADHAT